MILRSSLGSEDLGALDFFFNEHQYLLNFFEVNFSMKKVVGG